MKANGREAWEIPNEFRLVDLSDPSTWHLASLRNWVATRDSISAKLPPKELGGDLRSLFIQAEDQLDAEELKLKGKKPGDYLSGRQEVRRGEILANLLDLESSELPHLTPWEQEFLHVSGWIDTIRQEAQNTSEPAVAIRVLTELILNNEDELESHRRDRDNRLACSIQNDVGGGLPGGKIGYLPDPIDLLQAYRLAALFCTNLKKAVARAKDLELEADEYGSVYPCLECGEKFDHVVGAQCCCNHNYPQESVQDYITSVVLDSTQHRKHSRVFLHFLWQFGFHTAKSLEQLNSWSGWSKVRTKPAAEFSRRLLGFLFGAKPETIRRKITTSELEKEYNRHRIPEELRHLPNKAGFGLLPAELSPRGWYVGARIQPDTGMVYPPSKRIGIHVWSSQLSYRSPLRRLVIPRPRESIDDRA